MAAAKEWALWTLGYRRCPMCELFSAEGWPDEAGVWYCEECQMNCILDLFDPGFAPPARSWLREVARQLPAAVCSAAGSSAWGAARLSGTLVVGAAKLALNSRSRPAADGIGAAMTPEVFDRPWLVVVDSRDGRLEVGDPVEVRAGGGGAWTRGTVRERARDGHYVVEDGAEAARRVPQEDVRLDVARVTKV